MENQNGIPLATSSVKKRNRSQQAEQSGGIAKRGRLLTLDTNNDCFKYQDGAMDVDEPMRNKDDESFEHVKMANADSFSSLSNLEENSNADTSSVGTEIRQAQARAAALKLRRKKDSHASLHSSPQQQTAPSKLTTRQTLVSSPYNRTSQGLIRSCEARPKLPVPEIRSNEQQNAVVVQDPPLGEIIYEAPLEQEKSPSKVSNIDVDTGEVLQQKLEPPKALSLDADKEEKIESLPPPPQVLPTVAGEIKIPQTAVPQQARYLDVPKPDKVDWPSIFRKPKFWTTIFLLIQIGMYLNYPDLVGSVLSAFVFISEESILLCKNKLGFEPNLIEKITKVEVKVGLESEPQIIFKNITDSSQVTDHIEDLMASKEAFTATRNLKEEKSTEMANQLQDIKSKLSTRRKALEEWKAAIKKSEEEINELVATSPRNLIKILDDYDVADALENLHESAKITVQTEIITTNIPMWEIVSESNCNFSTQKNDPIVSSDDIATSLYGFNQHSLRLVSETKDDSEIRDAVRALVENNLEAIGVLEDNLKFNTQISKDENNNDEIENPGLTKEAGQKIIKQRIEYDFANKIGIFDAAALFNGAQLIRSGARATSPSLTESLPLLNRLMAYTKLQDCGYGAEVALTPTAPKDAVGQCWPFKNVAKSKDPVWHNAYKMDKANGKFASLTVRFVSTVLAKRVVIEHVTSPGKPLSAIRNFRIIGYEDEDAVGDPLNLGTFQYRSDGDLSQEFLISEKNVAVKSITLAVDSAYQKDFACLYRFSVMEA